MNKNGLNRSMYIDINGSKQWINIYTKDINNPVLLYLHGGPGYSTSHFDHAFTRKWADVYNVVTWDQRNCGKSYSKDQKDIKLTKNLFLQDGKELTEFLLKYFSKDKITLLGHSWGTIFGANLALEFPEYYDAFIGTGQLVDIIDNEVAFKEEALIWSENDPQGIELVNQLTPTDFTLKHIDIKNTIMKRYRYDINSKKRDYSLLKAILFNPNYTLKDWIKYFKRDHIAYLDFIVSDEFKDFSLKNKTKYQMPYYNINGDKDFQTNYKLAQVYFDQIEAPFKKMYIMEDMSHGLLECRSIEFSKIIHEIKLINDSLK